MRSTARSTTPRTAKATAAPSGAPASNYQRRAPPVKKLSADGVSRRGAAEDGGVEIAYGHYKTFVFPPSMYMKQNSNADRGALPKEELELEYAYGYNGEHCRDNLHMISDHQIVYNVAAVGVVLDINTNQQRCYRGHTRMITSLTYCKRNGIVISGQHATPKSLGSCFVAVWRPDEAPLNKYGRVPEIGRLAVNERCIDVVRFSASSKYIYALTTDKPEEEKYRNGILYCWATEHVLHNVQGKACSFLIRVEATSERVLGIRPHPTIDEHFVTFGSAGHVHFKRYEHPDLGHQLAKWGRVKRPNIVSSAHYVETGSDPILCVGTDEGLVIILENQTAVRHVRLSSQPISVITANPVAPTANIMAAGFDCTVRDVVVQTLEVKEEILLGYADEESGAEDCRIRDAVVLANGVVIVGTAGNHVFHGTLRPAKLVPLTLAPHTEVHALASNPVNPEEIATGSHSGKVRFYSHLKCKSLKRPQYQADSKVWTLCWDATGRYLALGCDNGYVHVLGTPLPPASKGVYNYKGSVTENLWKGSISKERVSNVRFSAGVASDAQGRALRRLAAGSWDQNVYIVDILHAQGSPAADVQLIQTLSGNSSSVLYVQWSLDSKYIMSSSKDAQVLIWESSSWKRVAAPSTLREVQWFDDHHKWEALLGWPVVGIWNNPEYKETELNCVDSACNYGLCATGDDFALVKLFQFPLPSANAQSRDYMGHSSFIPQVRWSFDDVLMTVGGEDCTLLQWRITGTARPVKPEPPPIEVPKAPPIAKEPEPQWYEPLPKPVTKPPAPIPPMKPQPRPPSPVREPSPVIFAKTERRIELRRERRIVKEWEERLEEIQEDVEVGTKLVWIQVEVPDVRRVSRWVTKRELVDREIEVDVEVEIDREIDTYASMSWSSVANDMDGSRGRVVMAPTVAPPTMMSAYARSPSGPNIARQGSSPPPMRLSSPDLALGPSFPAGFTPRTAPLNVGLAPTFLSAGSVSPRSVGSLGATPRATSPTIRVMQSSRPNNPFTQYGAPVAPFLPRTGSLQ